MCRVRIKERRSLLNVIFVEEMENVIVAVLIMIFQVIGDVALIQSLASTQNIARKKQFVGGALVNAGLHVENVRVWAGSLAESAEVLGNFLLHVK